VFGYNLGYEGHYPTHPASEIHQQRIRVALSEDLAEFRIGGFGGSDMAPGINRLAEAPEIQSAMILTDGYIYYPTIEPPYRLLWVLIGDRNRSFDPPYGEVMEMELRR
jgi:predicted metal-dependent peptidase